MNFDFNKLKKNNIPYIIAEIGVNHECSMKMAKKLILLSKIGGAQAVKFQTYKADKIVKVKSKAYWDLKKEKTTTQRSLFEKYDKFDDKEFKSLYLDCRKKKLLL